MVDKQSIAMLRAIEEKLDSVHEMIEGLILRQAHQQAADSVKLSNEWPEDETSGQWTKHGLVLRISRDFISKYIPSLKWFILGAVGYGAGWFSKLFHLWATAQK